MEYISCGKMSNTIKRSGHKTRKTKSKSRKRKPKLTKEFQDTEKEVAAILHSTEFTVDQIETDPEKIAISFFCDKDQLNRKRKVKGKSQLIINETESSDGKTDTFSSFIQIEDDQTIREHHMSKVNFDRSQLYIPSSSLNLYVQNPLVGNTGQRHDKNLIRLLNRYQTEKQHNEISSQIPLKEKINFFKDDRLYATMSEREFLPIFYNYDIGAKNSVAIPRRKLITLTLKCLKFSDYPMRQEEHVIANKLEEQLHMYFTRKDKKIIPDLMEKLSQIRNTVDNLLESGATTDFATLDENLTNLKKFRSKLHEEEMISKNLLRQILDTWLELKELRKNQNFHWTPLKLKIKLNEMDMDKDMAAWTKRYETELNEIYREELQQYYRARRLRKTVSNRKSSKLKKPNLEDIKVTLKTTLNNCTRQPGEPEIEVFCSKLVDPCQTLPKTKYFFLRIFFDGELLGSTRSLRLESDLSLAISESFRIYLDRGIPKEVTIKLYEKKKLPTIQIKLANILIPISTTSGNETLDYINFSSHKNEPISGRLFFSFECDDGTTSGDSTDRDTLSSALHQATIQPYDIKIEKSSRSKEPSEDEDKDVNEGDQETCTFRESLLEFCPPEDINNNKRLRLLARKYRNDLKAKDIQFVPYLEHEVEEQCEDRVIDIGNWMDPIDIYKHTGKKYLKQVYQVLANHCERLVKSKGQSEQILVESSMNTLKSFFTSFNTVFGPSRPLRPTRMTEPDRTTCENINKFNLVVNVVRATGIPIRTQSSLNLDKTNSSCSTFSSQTFRYSNVRPFVSVSYLDTTCRTITAHGSNPTWNEHLVLPIQGNPVELKGDVKIAIFDEYVENYKSDIQSLEVYQRFQSNWLGEYRLPISTILAEQKIDGTFELSSPKVLLGYDPPSLNEALSIDNSPEIKNRVNLWLYVSVEPSFNMPKIATYNLECSELKEIRNHIQAWCIEAKEMQPARFVDPLVCTVDGKLMCLTRLLEPIPLPVETGDNALDIAVRYASLLNCLKNFDPCTQFRGIWLNNQALLDTGWGSPKDFGVLLANYFLAVGIPCAVVLGVANQHGETAYILHKDGKQFVMTDPCTGKKYSTNDVNCPMIKVFCIFSRDNIFCNIQAESRVAMTNFDVNDTSCWFPLFSRRNPAPLGGVQNLSYEYRSSHSITELKKAIERKIMKKISSWRPMQKTIWNRAFQNLMLNILINLEKEIVSESIPRPESYSELFARDFKNYKVFGYTLNFPYTNLSSISERVKSTGIHLNCNKAVEFSVAVYVYPYPGDILSVWIFLLSAVPI